MSNTAGARLVSHSSRLLTHGLFGGNSLAKSDDPPPGAASTAAAGDSVAVGDVDLAATADAIGELDLGREPAPSLNGSGPKGIEGAYLKPDARGKDVVEVRTDPANPATVARATSGDLVGSGKAKAAQAEVVVGSEEVETGRQKGQADGQNLSGSLGQLLGQLGLSAKDFARAIVGQTGGEDQLAADGTSRAGADTVAAFDMSAYPTLRTAVDGLGDALSAASSDPANRRAIEQALVRTPQLKVGGSLFEGCNQRDLGTACDELLAGIADGTIADKDGRIAGAARAAQGAIGSTELAFKGSEGKLPGTTRTYSSLAGVGVAVDNPVDAARAISSLQDQADDALDALARPIDGDPYAILDKADDAVGKLHDALREAGQTQLAGQLDRQLQSLDENVYTNLRAKAAALVRQTLDRGLQALDPKSIEQETARQIGAAGKTSGWAGFLTRLSS